MIGMNLPVGGVLVRNRLIPDYEQVLGVVVFSRFGEVETARDDHAAIDDHDFIMGDGVFRIDQGRNAGITDEIGGKYFSVRWLLSKITWIFTPRLWASTRALAMGTLVKE